MPPLSASTPTGRRSAPSASCSGFCSFQFCRTIAKKSVPPVSHSRITGFNGSPCGQSSFRKKSKAPLGRFHFLFISPELSIKHVMRQFEGAGGMIVFFVKVSACRMAACRAFVCCRLVPRTSPALRRVGELPANGSFLARSSSFASGIPHTPIVSEGASRGGCLGVSAGRFPRSRFGSCAVAVSHCVRPTYRLQPTAFRSFSGSSAGNFERRRRFD